ncbi:MAG: NosD domain-containing protein [Syntrophomonas sp.]|nr:NosD domain-containing protein [Syntrophomonas sp.]
MAHEAFISYASVNQLIANTVCVTLESNKISCWMAPRDILPGKDFAAAIIDAIEQARVFILILSKNSAASPHVLRELNKAASKGIPILPFIIEEVTLSKSLEYYLSTDHWLNATTPPLSKHIHNLALVTEKLLLDIDSLQARNTKPAENNYLNESSSNAQRDIADSVETVPMFEPAELDASEDILIVDPKGSGKYRKINEAIDAAYANQTIIVKPGSYREQIILAGKPVKLYGDGKDAVKVSYPSGSVLEANSSAGSEITGFSFSKSGYNDSSPVCLIKSSISMKNCRISGGETGILVLDGRPVIANNVVERNINGITVSGESAPLISENICNNNKSAILFCADAVGKAYRNECKNNHTGITVTDHAQPNLQENDCIGNKETGISYLEIAAGKASNNNCIKNINGIIITDHAQPTLESNASSENRQAGILYNGHEGGVARENKCIRNRTHGLHITFKAQPFLEGNQSSRNKLSGIAFMDTAAGIAKDNICSNNDLHGILIKDRAQPELDGNRCNENREAGIAYFDYAQGIARNNICRGNRLKDITINNSAMPILIPND